MQKFQQIDITKVKTISITSRKSKVKLKDFAKVFDPGHESFNSFIGSFPNILAAKDFCLLADDIVRAHKQRKQIIVLMGAHVIKVGLSPLINDLLRRGIITCLAMNGAAAIHDVEISMWGKTSEEVEENIQDGSFGMSKETGEFINNSLRKAVQHKDIGFGEAIGKQLQKAQNKKLSLLSTCCSLDIPATVHVAIGTDIIHQQPTMDGSLTGEMTFRDFKIFCSVVKNLNRGGVVMNFGSAVILPEVFLKALTVARNLGANAKGFTTANFDMIQHYRPRMNVVMRPTAKNGKGYLFTGHHEIMIPLLCAAIKDKLRES